jgi:hypothetical protein
MAKPKTKRVLAITEKIAAAKRQIEELEAELEEILYSDESRKPSTVSVTPVKGTGAESSVEDVAELASAPERMLAIMKAAPNLTYSADTFAARMKDVKLQSIRSTIVRLHGAKKIEKVARGYYRLAMNQIPQSAPATSSGSK